MVNRLTRVVGVLAIAVGCAPNSPRANAPASCDGGGGQGCANSGPVQYTAEGVRRPNEWPVYGGDAGGLKYSPLTQIDRSNVSRLEVAWTWKTGEQPIAANGTTLAARPGQFQVTPLAIGDTLFLTTPYNRVVALDAVTGEEIWTYDPEATALGQPSNGTGFVHRGVATWTDGRHRLILVASRYDHRL